MDENRNNGLKQVRARGSQPAFVNTFIVAAVTVCIIIDVRDVISTINKNGKHVNLLARRWMDEHLLQTVVDACFFSGGSLEAAVFCQTFWATTMKIIGTGLPGQSFRLNIVCNAL